MAHSRKNVATDARGDPRFRGTDAWREKERRSEAAILKLWDSYSLIDDSMTRDIIAGALRKLATKPKCELSRYC